ncbi:beta-lactamase family protein [Pendulispora brunnea]|uniref:Beta-lactamase family protein n=1 Tax=Pendulispora brunnea TaxID=2905690 RepID=A0ABZ2KAQ6_9BACT
MKTRFSKIMLLLLALCALPALNVACGDDDPGIPAPDKTALLRQTLQDKFAASHAVGDFPGGTAGVVLADGSSFGLAVGVSDRATQRRMLPGDLLPQASVGKTYVAGVALQLVHEGKLALDDKVEKYLGEEPWFGRLPNAHDITIRMIMKHTSGLMRYEYDPNFTAEVRKDPYRIWKREEQLSFLFDKAAPFPAGQGWEYSDTNYMVLGLVIEHITNSTYYTEAKKRLFDPLGLDHAIFMDRPDIPIVQGYAGDSNVFSGTDAMMVNGKMTLDPGFEWCGGGVASTAEELARWVKLLYEGRAFDPTMLPAMLDGVPAPALGEGAKYGIATILLPSRLGMTYGHSGTFPGYLTRVMYFPDTKVAVAVQVNTSPSTFDRKRLVDTAVELAVIASSR